MRTSVSRIFRQLKDEYNWPFRQACLASPFAISADRYA